MAGYSLGGCYSLCFIYFVTCSWLSSKHSVCLFILTFLSSIIVGVAMSYSIFLCKNVVKLNTCKPNFATITFEKWHGLNCSQGLYTCALCKTCTITPLRIDPCFMISLSMPSFSCTRVTSLLMWTLYFRYPDKKTKLV